MVHSVELLFDTDTDAAVRAKDSGARCDIEAGMAKLLAARIESIDPGLGIEAMTLVAALAELLSRDTVLL